MALSHMMIDTSVTTCVQCVVRIFLNHLYFFRCCVTRGKWTIICPLYTFYYVRICTGISVTDSIYQWEKGMTVNVRKVHFVSLTSEQLTGKYQTTTHCYLHYSHRIIISHISTLQGTVTFSTWLTLLLFPSLLFFLGKTVTFCLLLFSLLLCWITP